MDFQNFGSKVVGSRQFLPSKSLWNSLHAIFLTGVMNKPRKDIKFVLVERNFFLTSTSQMKVFLLMVYIQEHHSDSEDIIKDSNFQIEIFVIHKFMSACMMVLYVYKSLSP